MTAIQEQFLLARIRAFRDHEAFERITSAHKAALFRFLRSKLPNKADAEDAMSVTMLRAWTYLTSGTQVQHVSGLLFTIARSVVAEYYRSASTRPSVSMDALSEAGQEFTHKTESSGAMEARADLRLLKEKLSELTEDEQLAITMKYFEGYSISDIAEQIEKSVNATTVMLHRALKKLRKLMDVSNV